MTDQGVTADLTLTDAHGAVVASVQGLQAATGAAQPQAQTAQANGETVLRGIVADMLKFDLAQVDSFTRFYDFGFDSIALAALTDKVNIRFGANLTPAVFYDVANIAQLAAQLAAAITHPEYGHRLGVPAGSVDAQAIRGTASAAQPRRFSDFSTVGEALDYAIRFGAGACNVSCEEPADTATSGNTSTRAPRDGTVGPVC